MAMRSNKRFMTVKFEDGSVAVVQTDPSSPRLLEVVARFSDASHARNYADAENNRSAERPTVAAVADSVARRLCGPVDEAAVGGGDAIRISRAQV